MADIDMAKKKTKKKVSKAYVVPDPRELRYCADYEAYIGQPNNCDCGDDYHRCAVFSGGEIKSVYYDSIFHKVSGRYNIVSVKDYCLDRWIRKEITTGSFEVYGVRGYYGDEAEVSMDTVAWSNLKDFVHMLNTDTNQKCIEEVLYKEYGYILPPLEGKDWKVVDKVNIDLISSAKLDDASPEHIVALNREVVGGYLSDLKCDYKSKYLSCMCIKHGNSYRLIDGNHRLAASRALWREKMDNYKRGCKPSVYMTVVYCV